jgi:hypothetical protein
MDLEKDLIRTRTRQDMLELPLQPITFRRLYLTGFPSFGERPE